MSSWQRHGVLEKQQLYPFVVPMLRQGWLTHQEFSRIAAGGEPRWTWYNRDFGGDIHLNPAWHNRLVEVDLFDAYCIQRRTLKPTNGGTDFFGEPIAFARGDTFIPNDPSFISDDDVGLMYDICMSFATAREAVAFRVMIQGVVPESFDE